jgi:hypothetical protein
MTPNQSLHSTCSSRPRPLVLSTLREALQVHLEIAQVDAEPAESLALLQGGRWPPEERAPAATDAGRVAPTLGIPIGSSRADRTRIAIRESAQRLGSACRWMPAQDHALWCCSTPKRWGCNACPSAQRMSFGPDPLLYPYTTPAAGMWAGTVWKRPGSPPGLANAPGHGNL